MMLRRFGGGRKRKKSSPGSMLITWKDSLTTRSSPELSEGTHLTSTFAFTISDSHHWVMHTSPRSRSRTGAKLTAGEFVEARIQKLGFPTFAGAEIEGDESAGSMLIEISVSINREFALTSLLSH